jgi:shikimate kinase
VKNIEKPPVKIFLLGLPGSGKTTLGKSVAHSLAISFVDLDAEIERSEGIAIKDIFKTRKEPYFREAESRELRKWCADSSSWVMATGGGAPCFFDNMEVINQSGISIFLDVPPRIIAERILQTPLAERPLFATTHPESLKDHIEWMRTHRMSYYRQAHLMLTGEAITAAEVLSLVKGKTQS